MTDIPESEASPGAEAAARASKLAARVAAWRREQAVVDYAHRGLTTPEIAARLGVPEAEARKKLRDALARALPESPETFAALQMSRLNEVLLVAFSAMETMGLKAVDRVLRILRALDRQHAAARPLALAAASAREEAEPASAPTPDAATASRERNPIAVQPLDKPQNRSQTPAPSSASDNPPTPSPDLPLRAAQRTGRGGPLEGGWRGPRHEAPGASKTSPSHRQPIENPRFQADFAGRAARPGLRDGASSRAILAALGLGGASLPALAAAGT